MSAEALDWLAMYERCLRDLEASEAEVDRLRRQLALVLGEIERGAVEADDESRMERRGGE